MKRFIALYRLQLRLLATRSRIVLLLTMGAVGVIVAAAVGRNTLPVNQLEAGAELLNEFGLWLLVPVPTLIFATAALGDPTDDRTLVYLWLRPVPRWQLATSAGCAAFTLSWPLVVPALTISALLVAGDFATSGTYLVGGVLVASTLTMVAYVGIFVALGLRVRWPLAWGLLYIIIWEGFVARGSETAAKLALRAYGSSILRDYTGVPLLTSDIAPSWALAMPLVFALAGIAYTTFRLRRQDVA